ncbi:unnamed protein product [Pseudo-nitzschia multistriata]|uniref:Uncharacterized protein n=1 Tax=Pseudo-nitzschia multistriata TaxID=183589 RepID=A0A448ZGK7_9STRA|nr:unnamed protein product [Pseudo-nitzschia multistriata]
MKRKYSDESILTPFQRDMRSQRQQALEGIRDAFQRISPREAVTKEDAIRVSDAVSYCNSLVKNRVDTRWSKEEDTGEVVAMGTEDNGACGLLEDPDGARLFEYEPTLLPESKVVFEGDKAVTAVAAGGLHSACLARNGEVYTWGTNDEMALGRGNLDDADLLSIKPMVGIKDAIQISAGDNHTVVLDCHGKVHTAGVYKDSDSGLFKELTSPNDLKIHVQKHKHHEFPVQVLGLGKIVMVDAGHSWNAALDENGDLYTWGMGHSGELARSKSMGATTTEASYIDSDGKDKGKYEKYDVSKNFIGEVRQRPELDSDGQPKRDEDTGKIIMADYWQYHLDKIRDKFLTPAPVEWIGGLKKKVEHFSCGMIHLLVVARDPGSLETRVFGSGNSGFGQLGHGDTKELHQLTPIKALDNKKICKVAAGCYHNLALSRDGVNLFAWGKLDEGATGLYNQEKTESYTSGDFEGTPKQVAFPDTLGNSVIVDIAAGDTTSFAITDGGDVYSWGYNENSQTGHYSVAPGIISQPRLLDVIGSVNTSIEKSKKTPIAKKCRVTRVSGGGQHSLMVIKRYR